MEWKKDNTDSEKLKQMEKEYIEAALKMMKKAGINSAEMQEKPEAKEEDKAASASEEIHNENTESEENAAEEAAKIEEEESKEPPKDIAAEDISKTVSDSENETEAVPDGENESTEMSEAPPEIEEAEQEEAKKQSSSYGVFSADEIFKGDGIVDAEKIIEEIKMQNETMKKLTEEQEKPSEQPRICPKCGKRVDGYT